MKQLTDEQITNTLHMIWKNSSHPVTTWEKMAAHAIIAEFCKINGLTGEVKTTADDTSILSEIHDNLFVEDRGDGVWLVCLANGSTSIYSGHEQASAACKAWKARLTGEQA